MLKLLQLTPTLTLCFVPQVSVYMLELYNERLLDLFVNPNEAFNKKIEIKKDKKGLVFVQGAETKEAASAEALFALFKQGCMNRHIASTSMFLI